VRRVQLEHQPHGEKEARRLAAGGAEVSLDIIGRKGRDYLRRRPVTIRKEITGCSRSCRTPGRPR